ncbi:hypothetical protein CC1G_00525 [Coprinopsis cinerea okayama7|uniref:Uncharacterized protein n=1 Tax=Coprinopsis cinerea (strain Okayama-7 / 130 / ATCC MYA-4618 / FGSC 9003) TaxID=240176 RepID=A8N3A1_COPC7|nr:hypothetical protein CC1G_00525 [Coprinopsis cinerea okayama7\|eukprot:XP_001829346.2 hypothetical protein CC1G_00525 [Coprinopsis cinerea okayama7\
MPRPSPLNFSSARYNGDNEYNSLTPRTPHSRTARAEGGFAKLDISDANDDFDDSQVAYAQHQSAPLLHSSTSPRFSAGIHHDGPRSSKTEKSSQREPFTPLQRVLLVFGVFVGGIILFMLVLSWTNSAALHRYIGLDPNAFVDLRPGARLSDSYNARDLPTPNDFLEQCNKLHSGFVSHGAYWDTMGHGGHDMNESTMHHSEPAPEGTCSSSITYMLDGRVGLAADLALMAQAAALARERNRTFFVDDTYWNRGKWIDHFQDVRVGQPGPEPGCKRPPAKELVACPRTSKHWIINSRTAKFHFGHDYKDHYENAFGHDLNRQKPIFDFAHESFSRTIRPNAKMRKLINLAKQELVQVSAPHSDPPIRDSHTPRDNIYLAVHVRRGDRYPTGFQYHRNPIPIKVFADAIPETWDRLHKHDDVPDQPLVYIASDSPDAVNELALSYSGPSFTLERSTHAELKSIASDYAYRQKEFDTLPAEKRISLTKGAIVDLALITGLWRGERDQVRLDATICAVSSNFCRLAAVGLGWESAFGKVNDLGDIDNVNKHWVDIDAKGAIIPVWEPYELF